MPFFSVGNNDIGTATLNGVDLRHVIECDTDKGFAVIYRTDAEGGLVIDREERVTDTGFGVSEFSPRLDSELKQ